MKYLSIDIETTGLNPENCQILSVGIVVEDTNNIKPIEELPSLHIAILRENICGSVFAINLNKKLIENINSYQIEKMDDNKEIISKETNTVYLKEENVVERIFEFLWDNNIRFDDWETSTFSKAVRIKNGVSYPILSSNIPKTHLNVAGKNFGTFDKLFLDKLPRWKQVFQVRNRIIDPAILFVDWKNDKSLPGLDKCKERAGFDDFVSHNALEDAIDVIKLLRKSYE